MQNHLATGFFPFFMLYNNSTHTVLPPSSRLLSSHKEYPVWVWIRPLDSNLQIYMGPFMEVGLLMTFFVIFLFSNWYLIYYNEQQGK
jgi:hypothetical protein